jgi:anti-sigma factor RsiW
MNCAEVRRMLDAYVDGELDLIRQGEVETHLPVVSPVRTRLKT